MACVTDGKIVEVPVWREWRLEGLDVSSLQFDYRVQIFLWTEAQSLSLTLEAPFLLSIAGSIPTRVTPPDVASMAGALQLLHRQASMLRASSDGQVILVFEDGSKVTCMPDERFEAWASHGTGLLADASMLCAPGGGRPWQAPEPTTTNCRG